MTYNSRFCPKNYKTMNLCFKLIVAAMIRNYSAVSSSLQMMFRDKCSVWTSEVEGEEQTKVKIYLTETVYVNFQRQKQLTVRNSWKLSILVCKHIYSFFLQML